MENNTLPLVGAQLEIKDLPPYCEWLIENQRDLEIQDSSYGWVLDSDWRSRVRQARDLLDGYTGRLSVHGPWDGLPLLCYDARVQELVVTRLKQALDFAAALGATQMVLHSPTNPPKGCVFNTRCPLAIDTALKPRPSTGKYNLNIL